MKKISILCLLLLSALMMLVGCKADPEAINNTPEVFADEASDVLRTSAVLTGRIMAPAKASIKEYGFLVSSSSDFTSSDTQTIKCDENLKEFSAQIMDLEIGGTYFYAAYATGGLDRMTSTVRAFTTPTRSGVLLSELRMVDEKSATFSARVADTGGGEINAVGLCWATDNTPTTYDETVITTLNSDNTFAASLTGLEAGKTYYVRAFADSDILGDGTTQTISYSRDVLEITLEEPINEEPSISVEALSATTTSITYQITSTAVEQVRQLIILEEALEVYGEITPEFVFISDYEIEPNTTVELTASDLTPASTYYVFAAAKAGEEYLISEPAVIATQPEEVDPELTKIYYTTTDEQTITSFSNPSGLNLVSNSYENGRGVITFDGVITQIPNNFMYGKSTLKSIALPGAVTQIGYGAFESCSALESLTLPEGVAEIGQMAFAYTALRELTLPESVAEIDNQAFMNCSDLERVTISGSPAVNTDAFSGCSSISSVHITSLEAWCKCDFGGWAYLMYSASNPCSYGATLYLNGAPVTEVTIPQGVTSLSDGAFAGCGSLLKVTIPDHVTEIGSRCFNACENLETVYCLSTTPATPKPEVFPGTYGDQYDWHPFSNDTGALTIYVPNASVESYRTAWLWKQYADCIYPMDGITSIANVSKADVIYTVEGIVTAVQQKAYILADQTGTILVYGEGHNRSIGDKIRLTTSSASYHGLIQLNTTYDTIVELLSTGNPWNYTPQIMSGPELDKLAGSSKCMEIQFSGKLYHKAMYAEMIVEDATVIPSLSYCDSSQYKDGDTTIKGYYVGTNNQYLMILSYDSELINSSTPETWKIYYTSTDGNIITPKTEGESVTGSTFGFGANVVSNTYENGQGVITFDGEVQYVGSLAFEHMTTLQRITLPNTVTEIMARAFDGCSGLEQFELPEKVWRVTALAFRGCTALKSVQFNSSLQIIGVNAFDGCTLLDGVIIPDSVTSIDGAAFQNCSSITTITIPEGVASIGGNAFYGCSTLATVYCSSSTPPTGGYQMFDGNTSDRKIYVPNASVDAYKAAEYWSDYAADIVGYDF